MEYRPNMGETCLKPEFDDCAQKIKISIMSTQYHYHC